MAHQQEHEVTVGGDGQDELVTIPVTLPRGEVEIMRSLASIQGTSLAELATYWVQERLNETQRWEEQRLEKLRRDAEYEDRLAAENSSARGRWISKGHGSPRQHHNSASL